MRPRVTHPQPFGEFPDGCGVVDGEGEVVGIFTGSECHSKAHAVPSLSIARAVIGDPSATTG
jgi:hypothetical protein